MMVIKLLGVKRVGELTTYVDDAVNNWEIVTQTMEYDTCTIVLELFWQYVLLLFESKTSDFQRATLWNRRVLSQHSNLQILSSI